MTDAAMAIAGASPVHAAFDDLGPVHGALAAFDADKLDESFDSRGASPRLRLPSDRIDALKSRLRDATRDRVRVGAPQSD